MSKVRVPQIVQTALENTVGLNTKETNWKVLAEHLNVSEKILRNKISDSIDSNHISLAEAIALVEKSESLEIVEAICEHFDGAFLKNKHSGEIKNAEALKKYTAMMGELGKFSADIEDSLEDGKITPSELKKLHSDFLHLSGALNGMMVFLRDKAAQDEQEAKKLKR
ncbi:phage regulatory CII family protein [Undibacterium squillarum]|uniref:phage regulatory CII family protein n=1 Tax=Undibacterium squillarum TaxID=1131567 RepID=UPI0035B31E41